MSIREGHKVTNPYACIDVSIAEDEDPQEFSVCAPPSAVIEYEHRKH